MRRKRLKPYKISRGSLEEQKLREDNRFETQRALLFILPLVMVAVLVVGVFFGYKGYVTQRPEHHVDVSAAPVEEPTEGGVPLTVVSSAHTLGEDDVPALTDWGGVQVSPLMIEDLSAMTEAARQDGVTLELSEGYVSYAEQGERYESAVEAYRKSSKTSLVKAEAHVKRTTPRAGESEQQTGLLIRLTDGTDGAFRDSDAYTWLTENSVTYGFVLRYPEQENAGGLGFSADLFRYVGREHAYFMRAYNMNFDEYAAYRAAQ